MMVTVAVIVSGGLLAGTATAVTPQSITTLAGNGTAGSTGDGLVAVSAELNVPAGVAEDLTGSLYIADAGNNDIRKVSNPTTDHADIIDTIAGTGAAGFGGDGGPATAAVLDDPTGIAVDTHGDVFIADTGNNRVREINPSGTITTIAGTGRCSFTVTNNIPAVQASLCAPTGIAVDSQGDVFISDTGHNVVREVNSSGTIEPFAGTRRIGHSGDGGPAGSANLAGPTALAIDAAGNVYIADTGNCEVRVVSGGTINRVAGTGTCGYGGDGGPATDAELSFPTGLSVNSLGAVYISDTGNSRIREVAGGDISTFAGTGTPGFSGDGGPATAASLFIPIGSIAVDDTAVYFADAGNHRVRGIFNGPPPVLSPQL